MPMRVPVRNSLPSGTRSGRAGRDPPSPGPCPADAPSGPDRPQTSHSAAITRPKAASTPNAACQE